MRKGGRKKWQASMTIRGARLCTYHHTMQQAEQAVQAFQRQHSQPSQPSQAAAALAASAPVLPCSLPSGPVFPVSGPVPVQVITRAHAFSCMAVEPMAGAVCQAC